MHNRSYQDNSGSSSPSTSKPRPAHHSPHHQSNKLDVRPREPGTKSHQNRKYVESRVKTQPRYSRNQNESSSSSSSEDEDNVEPEPFYLSSASEDEGDRESEDVTHLVQGEDHRGSNGTSRSRKNVYGGSHSSRASSSVRSSGGSLSPKSHKRRSKTRTLSPPPSSRKRMRSPVESPTHPSGSGSDSDELPTMVPIQRPSYSPLEREDREDARPSSIPVKRAKKSQKRNRDGSARSTGNGFLAPNAHRRKPRGENTDIPVRALEYKNLPFRTVPIQNLMGRAVKLCREGTIHDTIIMMHYTRSQEVRRAVEATRERILRVVNVSMSCPFLTQHTKPKNHSTETVETVSEALAGGSRSAWMLDEEHIHNNATRTSDYRTILIQAATPCDFICVMKMCLELAQTFSKQVCLRLCTMDCGMNPLPIYEEVVADYASRQFETRAQYPRHHTTPTAYPNRPVDSDLE